MVGGTAARTSSNPTYLLHHRSRSCARTTAPRRDRCSPGRRVVREGAPSGRGVAVDRRLDRHRFSAFHTFGGTKAANLMFTFELARRGKRWDVRANAFHPGIVRSKGMREAPGAL